MIVIRTTMNILALELTRIPFTTLRIMLQLAKTLRRDKPAKITEVVEVAGARLDKVISQIETILAARQLASNPEILGQETNFDRGVDGLWILLRRELENRAAYAHAGLDYLPPELAKKADLEGRRAEARRAQKLWLTLFGAKGTNFTKSRIIVQSGVMATLLEVIEKEKLRDELVAVVGEDLVKLIEVCQGQYEQMVDGRLNRESGAEGNLNDLRTKLRWSIVAYVQAVQTFYDPDKAETEALVLNALRPIMVLREALARAGSKGEAEPTLEDFVQLDEVLDEDEALGEVEVDEIEEDEPNDQ